MGPAVAAAAGVHRECAGWEAAQNRACGLPAELLVEDGMGERLERRETARAQFDRANAVNQPGHRRVGSEVGQCAFAHRATIAIS